MDNLFLNRIYAIVKKCDLKLFDEYLSDGDFVLKFTDGLIVVEISQGRGEFFIHFASLEREVYWFSLMKISVILNMPLSGIEPNSQLDYFDINYSNIRTHILGDYEVIKLKYEKLMEADYVNIYGNNWREIIKKADS